MNRIFGRNKDHREHMLRNLATSLVLYEKVDTTRAKAKELKSFIDKVIARSKKADLSAIRNLHKVFFDDNAIKKVVEVLVPRYEKRSSGFTKTYNLKNRIGDNSAMMRIELVDKKVFVTEKTENIEMTAKEPESTAKTEKGKTKESAKAENAK